MHLISFNDALLVLSAYILAPGLTFSFIGPRPFSLTPRNFSQFVFLLSCFFLIISLSNSLEISDFNYVAFSVASILFSILLLSSKFGTQVLVSLLLAGIFDFKIALCIVLSAFFALFFHRSFFIHQIKAHVLHLDWYLKYNYPFVSHRSNFSILINFIKSRNLRGVFYEVVFFNQLFTSILRHPTYFLALVLGIAGYMHETLEGYQYYLLIILTVLFVPFIVTNFGKARVLGEAERYIEFAYPLQIILFFSVIPQAYTSTLISFILIYNVIWFLYNLYQLKHQYAARYSFSNLFSHLDRKDINLFCLNNNESWIFLKNTKANIIGFLVNVSMQGQYRIFFEKLFDKYPMVNPKYLPELCLQYNVTHILQNKQSKSGDVYEGAISALGKYVKIFEDTQYILYAHKPEL
ncbi:hypothetical protein [Legionella shakespearei]|nr:hypothetical protein [Legionella shakespearei]